MAATDSTPMPGIISRPSMYSRQATSVASSVMTRESSATGVSSTTSLSEIDDLEVEAPQHQTPEESAVVGFACRVPGAKSPDELWKNIVEQRDVQRKISKERFNVDAYYHPVGATKGTTNARYGYFLDDEDIKKFDPEFFKISGKEAESMDPQQRLLLEVVYEALENAGITLDEISGTKTSVYCGSFTNDYRDMSNKDLEYYPKYNVTGTGAAILSNRISFFYNLHGPSITVDTACSSSLVGFHMGNMSIRNRESDLSIVVGSACHFDPNIFTTMTDLGFLCSDGRCRAFDANGSGYVRGEGICAMVLKRKSLALSSGNSIRAIVRGTGSNHDGHKEGITMPNSKAQEALIRETYKKTGLSTHETGYFEAHGTGTQAGDPRETRAIGAVFAPNRKNPLHVGSIKTNVGHLEGASGLAGIIKSVLSIEHGKILPNMHFQNPNPNIDFKEWKINVPTKLIDWEPINGVRRASINSFGYGGSNAHVILEGYNKPALDAVPELQEEQQKQMVAKRPYLLPLTSHTEKAGKLLKNNMADFVESETEATAADLATSLSDAGRTKHRVRSFVIGKDRESVLDNLKATAGAWTQSSGTKPRIGFVFTGQGAQWFGMGRELMEQSPFFLQRLQECDRVLQNLPVKAEWSVVEELRKSKNDSRVNETAFSSPLCTAIQMCVVDLLRLWGVEPSACVGHSAGEMPAAYAAGILSFQDAMICAYYRGYSLAVPVDGESKVKGAMLAVGMSEAEALMELEKYPGKVVIGAINSPTSLTLSGDEPEIVELKKSLEERKIFCRQLQVERAYHSHHIVPYAPLLSSLIKDIKPQESTCRMFSSVTARVAEDPKMGGEYFTANLVGQVRFSDALTGILLDESEEQNVDILIEVGPHPALKGPSRQTIQALKLDIPYLPTIARGENAYAAVLTCAGQLFAHGYPVDLDAVNSNFVQGAEGAVKVPAGQKIKLPSYSWDHGKFWANTRVIRGYLHRQDRHTILGAPAPGAVDKHPRWRSFLRPSELPWLSHHCIEGKVIFPAAGYLTMAIEAAIRLTNPEEIKVIELKDVAVMSALNVSDKDQGTEVILEMQPMSTSAKRTSDTQYRFTIHSYADNDRCSEHCSGLVSVEAGTAAPVELHKAPASLDELRKRSNKSLPLQRYYDHLHNIGLQYGDDFRLISGNVECGNGLAMAPLMLRRSATTTYENDQCVVHPTFLDAALHPLFAGVETILGRPLEEPFVPTFIKGIKVSGQMHAARAKMADERHWVCADTRMPGPRVTIADISVRAENGTDSLVEITGLEATALGGSGADGLTRSLFFRTRWQPAFEHLNGSQVSDISQAVDLYAHQFPDKNILHFTSDPSAVKRVLRDLGGTQGRRRRFASITPYSPSKENTGTQWDALAKEYPGLIETKEPKAASFDLVVLGQDTTADVASYLKSDGVVITDDMSFNGTGMTRLFQNLRVSAWTMPQAEGNFASQPVTIVTSEEASQPTKDIISMIKSTHKGNVVLTTMPDLAKAVPASQHVLVLTSLDENVFHDDNGKHFESTKKLLSASHKNVMWVTRGAFMEASRPEQALVYGMARSLRNENDGVKFIALDVSESTNSDGIYTQIRTVLDAPLTEYEIAERDGVIYIPRLEADDNLNTKLPQNEGEPKLQPFGSANMPLALKVGKIGLLETLHFGLDETLVDNDLPADEVEIEVKASAINFRDIAASIGIIDDYRLGDEASGVVTKLGKDVKDLAIGDRVVAWRPGGGAHGSHLRNPAVFCHKMKSDMSFTVGAAFSCILTTAYYAFYDLAHLQPGETVLIHAAAGGVGQMAIQLAQMIGAKVIATCGSQAKRDLLKNTYGLKDNHILSSRDMSFVKGVMNLTNGKGVDVVLNSLAGEFLHATWDCLGLFGRFVEIGKRDIHENARIEMAPFRKNVAFHSLDVITVRQHNRKLGHKLVSECAKLMENGSVKPPESILELSYAEVEKAFRLLQMGKHTGKIVLVPHKDDMVPIAPTQYRRSTLFNPSKVYLLSGGLGGLGRTLAEWMVRKGAKQIAFLSRSGAARSQAKTTVQWLESHDIKVTVFAADATNYDEVKKCVDTLGNKLGGVFHAAVVLQDSPLNNMTHKQWQTTVDVKVKGADNLHRATQHLDLDFFVPFSSCSAVIGALGQANYAAANAYLDALMRRRREMGLAGSTMNVGMITGVGLVADDLQLEKIMLSLGSDPVNEDELLYQVEEAVTSSKGPIVDERGIDLLQTVTGINMAKKEYYWSHQSHFRNMYENHDLSGSGAAAGGNSLASMLAEAPDVEARAAVLTGAFMEKIAAVLSVPAESIQAGNPLSMYGLDSIVAVEFRKWFSKTINVDIALFEILSSKSIAALVTKAAGMMVIEEATASSDKSKAAASKEAKEEGDAKSDETSTQQASDDLTSIVRPANLPQSTFQRRMWFAHNMAEDRTALNLSVVNHIKGKPNPIIMKDALDELKRRNEMLRTKYFEGDEFAEQEPVDNFDSGMTYEDFSSEANPQQLADAFISALNKEELDIEEGDVWRSALIKTGPTDFLFANTMHHIAIDRGSAKAITQQFIELYDAVRAQKELTLIPEPAINYIDFAVWYEQHLKSDAMKESIDFWKNNLKGANNTIKLLPFAKRARPERMDNDRAVQRMNLPLPMLKRLKRVCARMGVTPFQFLLAAFRSFLYRYTEEEDTTILIIDGNRPRGDLEDVLGFFVNMIPLRFKGNLDGGFDHLLSQVKNAAISAISHSKVPFDLIVDSVDVEKSRKHFPLSQVVVNYQMHGKQPRIATKDFEIRSVDNEDVRTQCEIALEATEDSEQGLELRLEFATTLYAEDEMNRFFGNFLTYMTSTIQDHRQPIAEIPMCGPEELTHLREKYWGTELTKNTWDDASVMSKVLGHADTNPTVVALQDTDGLNVSYQELMENAKAVAAKLHQVDVMAGRSVGILAKPGVESITAMLGCLLNRCGYVPMDPGFALERLSFMAADSALPVILTGRGLEKVGADVAKKIDLTPQMIPIAVAKSCNGRYKWQDALPNDPFYTIYTSGSTGKPKGVVLTQANTQQMLSTMQNDYSFARSDVFLHQSSMSFDLSIVQIFGALTSGSTVVIASSEARKDPARLARLIKDSGVTVTYFTPTHFALLIEHAADDLRQCSNYRLAYFAGERLSVRLADAFHGLNLPAQVLNTWSPSELVVQTTIHKVANSQSGDVNIPIGYPLANCRHYILDPKMNPLPPSLVGEICVGGGQVGAGYLNRPDANAKSFVQNPFASEEDQSLGWTRLFRTGDKGRFLPDAQLEFHGRIAGDKQVKLRGFRIDLGEVEHRIYLESAKIRGRKLIDVAVCARAVQGSESTALTDERKLIAFLVCNQTLTPEAKSEYVLELNQRIMEHLNAYMVPNGYQFLQELPVTVGGKVDIQNLLKRELQLTFPYGPASASTTKMPGKSDSADEKIVGTISQIFKEVLKLAKGREVGPMDDFFELGGQSILLLRLHSKLKRNFKSVPTLPELFKSPTPLLIAQRISGKTMKVSSGESSDTDSKEKINWREEAELPTDKRYVVPYGSRAISRNDVTDVLITGVESFIGLQMLATLLEAHPHLVIYAVGSEKRVEADDLISGFKKYKLFNTKVTEEALLTQVRCVSGTLAQDHFGLADDAFQSLGRSVQAIYHLGGRISLLKTYQDLKRSNVGSTLDVIELAAAGQSKTEIHALSTWSVPHLQSTYTAKRQSVDTSESKTDHFEPGDDAELVYFKSRWVSEMLLTQAAERGFGINMYRATVAVGSTATGVPEPEEDVVRRGILDMVEAGAVPEFGAPDVPPFAIDFIPVNYLTQCLADLADSEELRPGQQSADRRMPVYHLSNPRPLNLLDLPALMPRLRPDGRAGTALPLQDWSAAMHERSAGDEKLRLRVLAMLKTFEAGHVMFALDRAETQKALDVVGEAVTCPPVDEALFRKMMKL